MFDLVFQVSFSCIIILNSNEIFFKYLTSVFRRRGGLYRYIITANIDEPKRITRRYTLSAFTHEMTRTVTLMALRLL